LIEEYWWGSGRTTDVPIVANRGKKIDMGGSRGAIVIREKKCRMKNEK
jgi:hypothetical protein